MKDINKLVEKVISDDKKAFEELYDLTASELYWYCIRLCGNDADAKDLMQETYLKAWKKIKQYNGTGFKSWLHAIAHNLRLNKIRNQKDELFIDDMYEFAENDILNPQESAEQRMMYEEIVKLIDESLNDIQRMTVMLYYYDEKSVGEIAEEMECSESLVKVRLHRAREKLQSVIKDRNLYSVSLPLILKNNAENADFTDTLDVMRRNIVHKAAASSVQIPCIVGVISACAIVIGTVISEIGLPSEHKAVDNSELTVYNSSDNSKTDITERYVSENVASETADGSIFTENNTEGVTDMNKTISTTVSGITAAAILTSGTAAVQQTETAAEITEQSIVSEAYTSENPEFDEKTFFVVSGKFQYNENEGTILNYYYESDTTDGADYLSKRMVYTGDDADNWEYGDILSIDGDFETAGNQYAMFTYDLSLNDGASLVKIGNCRDMFEHKTLTEKSVSYDGRPIEPGFSVFTFIFDDDNGKDYYYSVNFYGSVNENDDKIRNISDGDKVVFAVYKDTAVIPLEFLKSDGEETGESSEISAACYYKSIPTCPYDKNNNKLKLVKTVLDDKYEITERIAIDTTSAEFIDFLRNASKNSEDTNKYSNGNWYLIDYMIVGEDKNGNIIITDNFNTALDGFDENDNPRITESHGDMCDLYELYGFDYAVPYGRIGGHVNQMLVRICENGEPELVTTECIDFDRIYKTKDLNTGEDIIVKINKNYSYDKQDSELPYFVIARGDATIDGNVDIRDVTKYARHIVKLDEIPEYADTVADIDNDGFIGIKDLMELKSYLIGDKKKL